MFNSVGKQLRKQWINFFYTFESLSNKVLYKEIKEVQSFITYLQKHDPVKLESIVNIHRDDGMTLLASAFVGAMHEQHYEIAICLLEAGAKPHAKLTKGLEGDTEICEFIRRGNLPGIRLLLWYDPNNYLDITDYKTGKTVREMLASWGGDAQECVELSTEAAQSRLEYLGYAQRYRAANNYAKLVETYRYLHGLCQAYADVEKAIPYHYGGAKAQQCQVQHYQRYGHRYLQSALQACEDWLASLGEPTSLNRAELAQYRSVLEQAMALSHQLGETKRQRRYQRLAASLPVIERSPATIEPPASSEAANQSISTNIVSTHLDCPEDPSAPLSFTT